jgi:aspartyl/asparaginyl beta-hydroxylase (cupin superfamily)
VVIFIEYKERANGVSNVHRPPFFHMVSLFLSLFFPLPLFFKVEYQ